MTMIKNQYSKAVFLTVLFLLAFLSASVSGLLAPDEGKTLSPGAGAPPMQLPTPGGYRVYLPSIVGGSGEPVALPPEVDPVCELTAEEQDLAALLIDDPGQQRPSLTCNPILSQVARQKAEDLGQRNYFDHVNPDGYGPNYLVQQAGYTLPEWYFQEEDANNIESLAGGFGNAQLAWDALLGSESHRIHVLGENEFFVEQLEYGVGYAYIEDSQYHYYWVILTARH